MASIGRFETASGAAIQSARLAYATYGAYDGSNAVLVCHPLTASHRPAGGSGPFDDWWSSVVGPGKAIDTREWFVVCVNAFGSPHGTSAPPRVGPDGEPRGSDFPPVTVGDWTRAQRQLLDRLGVDRLAAVVGGSVGGMNALEWARRYPERVDRVAAIATGPRLDPQCLALDAIARRAITTDPAWQGGDYHGGRAPTDGLAQARRIGHVMYLSKASMREKFGRLPASAVVGDAADAATGELPEAVADDGPGTYRAVESYLDYNAERFADRFDAASYRLLLRTMDEYDLSAHVSETAGDRTETVGDRTETAGDRTETAGDRTETAGDRTETAGDRTETDSARQPTTDADAAALAAFDGELLCVSFEGDWHFTPEQARRLTESARTAGVAATHCRIDSTYGHDAFLVEGERLAEPLGRLLEDGS